MAEYKPKPDSPCKNCANKGCGAYHSVCVLYTKFKKDTEEHSEWLSQVRQTTSDIIGVRLHGIRKDYLRNGRKY